MSELDSAPGLPSELDSDPGLPSDSDPGLPSFVVTGGVRPGDNSLSNASLFSWGSGASAALGNVIDGGTGDAFINSIAALSDHQGDAVTFAKVDPLVIDLDGDGVTLLNPLAATVMFDTDHGRRRATNRLGRGQ